MKFQRIQTTFNIFNGQEKMLEKWYFEGKKQEIWKESINNYRMYIIFINTNRRAQVFQSGEYLNNQSKGYWKFIFEDDEIGGGYYNEYGLKSGKSLYQQSKQLKLIKAKAKSLMKVNTKMAF
ncbi:unnamed protein product (macronuclear) [Paramecium tetraurelia]|uniref:Uncharacterized protein n=1 Tax=Paramecium tetraurelia TaxID=5888 RepID=A0DR63_PARTE|nr:uncharacterized protein GSPATT00019247001 [Paramecium tetraurelia]CAK85530.1 unnamed protein product [Paramecium tetraurelia]|eukprot:XP_001452927.1 hypothetical protein (macronuclear) [Paramecium tetraurelia strain d4-2]